MKKSWLTAAAAVLVASGPAFGQASPTDLITNGYFDTTTNGEGAYYTGTGTAPSGTTQATGWFACATTTCNTADGNYPFLFVVTPGIADGAATGPTNGFADPWDDSAGAGNSSNGIAYRSLWGAGNGGVGPTGTSAGAFNGYGPLGTSDPNNFLIADGGYHSTAIYQTVSGLKIGDHYAVSFNWAAGQWGTASGPTTEAWEVSLGNSTGFTSVYSLSSHAFSGWMTSTISFTATATSEALTFLADGTPVSNPPMLLLDDVTMYDTPEPTALSLLAASLAALALARRRGARGAGT